MNRVSRMNAAGALSVIVSWLLSAGTVHGMPTNDTCASAITVQAGQPEIGTNVGAASEVPFSPCGPSMNDDKDVWFKFRSSGAGKYRFQFVITLLTTMDDPSLVIYDSCNGAVLACSNEPGFELIDLNMGVNQTVYVRVAGSAGEEGTFELDIDQAPPPPVNDECGGALSLALNVLEFHENYEATPSVNPSSCFGQPRDVWFEFNAPSTRTYRVLMPNSDMAMSIIRGACNSGTEVICDSSGAEYMLAQVPLNANQRMRIRVDSVMPYPVGFAIRVDNYSPPTNDECSSAVGLTAGATISGTTKGATPGDDPDPFCGPRDYLDVWYKFTNTQASPLLYNFNVTRTTQPFEPSITAIDACEGAIIGCADNQYAFPNASLTISIGANQTVWIRVAGADLSDGDFTLSTSMGVVPAANDECNGAIALAASSSVQDSLLFASGFGDHLTDCVSGDNADVWYSFTNASAQARVYSFDTVGTSGLMNPVTEPTIAIFENCVNNPLGCSNQHYAVAPDAKIDLLMNPGQEVVIRLSASNGSLGNFQLNVSNAITPPAPPANDECVAATLIALPHSAAVAIGSANADVDIECDDQLMSPAQGGVWYRFTPSVNCHLVCTRNNALASAVSIFTGACGSLTEVDCFGLLRSNVELQAGTEYHVMVSRQFSFSTFPLDVLDFTLDCYPTITPGDACGNAPTITMPFHAEMYTGEAMNEGLGDAPAGTCNGPNAQLNGMAASVYMKWTAPSAGTLQGWFFPFFNDEIVAVYSGTCGALTEVACVNDPQPMAFSAPVTGGVSYIIQVGAYDDGAGDRILMDMWFTPPPCAADFNGNGQVQVADIFAFLNAWFSQFGSCAGPGCSADFNNSETVEVADIFAFLNAWFTEFGNCGM